MASYFKYCPKIKRHLFVKIHDIYLVSFSANPTTNFKTTNPNLHEFFDQISVNNLFPIFGPILTKLGDFLLLDIRTYITSFVVRSENAINFALIAFWHVQYSMHALKMVRLLAIAWKLFYQSSLIYPFKMKDTICDLYAQDKICPLYWLRPIFSRPVLLDCHKISDVISDLNWPLF